jgi:hypothetical protein
MTSEETERKIGKPRVYYIEVRNLSLTPSGWKETSKIVVRNQDPHSSD